MGAFSKKYAIFKVMQKNSIHLDRFDCICPIQSSDGPFRSSAHDAHQLSSTQVAHQRSLTHDVAHRSMLHGSSNFSAPQRSSSFFLSANVSMFMILIMNTLSLCAMIRNQSKTLLLKCFKMRFLF